MTPRKPFKPDNAHGRPSPLRDSTRASDGNDWLHRRQFLPGQEVTQSTGRPLLGVVVSGWASEARMTRDGRYQIFAFRLPGDLVVLRDPGRGEASTVLAVSRLELARAGTSHPAFAGATGLDGLSTALFDQNKRLFDQIIRLGALSAQGRAAHLLVELHDRLSAVGLVRDGAFRVPLTQEIFANVLGLSLVHMNRTLQQLRRAELITLRSGVVTLHCVDKLKLIAATTS